MFKKLNTLCFRISTQLCVSVARKLSEYFLQSRMSTRLRHTALLLDLCIIIKFPLIKRQQTSYFRSTAILCANYLHRLS